MAENTGIQKIGQIFGIRYVQTLLLFLCLVVNIIDRLKISFAVFIMTDTKLSSSTFKPFQWNKTEKGLIVSSSYWGMIPMQFMGNFMCQKYGAKLTILISTLGSAITNLLIPFLVPLGGWEMYIVISIVQGIFQSLFTPCIYNHIAKWAPTEERKRLQALTLSGIEMGTILAMGLPGLIAESSLGWTGISYVSGGLSIIWCILWAIYADNSPMDSRFISPEEKDYIIFSQPEIDDKHKKIPVPWSEIFTSLPFISLLIIECALALSFKTIQNELPSYLHGILREKTTSISLFSALPYLGRFVVNNLSFYLGELFTKKEIMSLARLQKTAYTISTWIPAVILLLIGFLDDKHETLILVLMIVTVGITGGKTIGSGLSACNLSPNHAATLMAITRTACNIVFMLTPIFSAETVNDGSELAKWRTLFVITALILFFSNFQFICLGKTETLAWDDENFKPKAKMPKNKPNDEGDNIQEQPTSTRTFGEFNGSYVKDEHMYYVEYNQEIQVTHTQQINTRQITY